jgi:hypothetical protein
MKAPLPWSMIMATGAVEPTEENLSAWFKAGVSCVGMGSKLFPKEAIASKDWQKSANFVHDALLIIQNIRNHENVFRRGFLLYSDTARKLYHEQAAKMPIIDYHCHLVPK